MHVHTLAEEEAAGMPLQQSCINVSSANMAVLLVETAGGSRKKSINKSGPRMDP